MAFTNDDWLPTVQELTVPELNVSSCVLRAGAHHFGKYCDFECKEFVLCMQERDDPRFCLGEGKQVTGCALQFFGKLKKHCYNEFTNYWKCIDHSGTDMYLDQCRKTQALFDNCVKEKLGQDRPPLGYFAKRRIHKTARPRHEVKEQILPPRIQGPPDDLSLLPEPKGLDIPRHHE